MERKQRQATRRSNAEAPATPPRDRDLARVYGTYQRLAGVYDVLVQHNEAGWRRRLRRELFSRVRGRILDAGIATGANIPFYPADSPVTGIDLSPAMLGHAKTQAERLHRVVDLRCASLTDTGLPDGSFDSVVMSFVLCCVPRGMTGDAFREVHRVLAANGTLYLLDYALPRAALTQRAVRVTCPH